ncbi:uncharacterized protein KZ484_026728 isoform 1-T3 [Pholidichthys leucotaenia]
MAIKYRTVTEQEEQVNRSASWKQNCPKVSAVPENQLQDLRGQKRKSQSPHEGLQEVFQQISEDLQASQGLQDVSRSLKELSECSDSNRRPTMSLDNQQASAVTKAFTCVTC